MSNRRKAGSQSARDEAPEVSVRPIEILLVEDNPADVLITVEALKDCRVSNKLSVVEDGEQALSFLRKNNGYSERMRPDLILLDLNLTRKDDHEVLAESKSDRYLGTIRVETLTTSETEHH